MVSVHSEREPEGEGGGQVVWTEADPGHHAGRLPEEHGPVLWSRLQGNDIYSRLSVKKCCIICY